MKGMAGKLIIAAVVLVICTFSIFTSRSTIRSTTRTEINMEELWQTVPSVGWRPSSAPRFDWPPPPSKTNGYLRVRCNGGLNQQRTAVIVCSIGLNTAVASWSWRSFGGCDFGSQLCVGVCGSRLRGLQSILSIEDFFLGFWFTKKKKGKFGCVCG